MAPALLALTILIRVYSPDAPMPMLDRALGEAAAVLGTAGVAPEWVRCGAGRDDPACGAALAGGELAVRFAAAAVPAGYAGRLPLGDSLIDSRRHAGVLATIYPERVLWLARSAGVEPTRLLGHAIAHEIAHLLLGSQRHAERGLMRAVWTREDLERDRPADWTLTPADAAAIRRRVIALTGTRQARVTARATNLPVE